MRTSLRTRLTAIFIGLAVVPLLLAGLALAWQSLQVQQRQALALQGEVARRVSTAVDAFVRGLEGDLLSMVQVQGLAELDAGQQKQALAQLLDYQGAFAELTLLDGDGREQVRLARLRTFADADLGSRSTADEFTMPRATGETYYSAVRFDQVLGEPLMTVAVPLATSTGGQGGVLVADARLKKVWDVIAATPVGEGESVYIVTEDGRVIAHRNPSVVLRGARFAPAEDGIQAGLDAPRVVLASDALQFGAQSFRVVAEKATSQALNLALNALVITGVLTLIALAGAIVLGFTAVRRILRPIDRLTATAQAITSGDLSQEARVVGSDEIAYLGNAFNRMTGQLRQTLAGLEQRVAERTSDLERRSAYLRAAAEVGAVATSILDAEELIDRVVELIRERFGLYYVGLFLVGEEGGAGGEWAVLRAGTGAAGQAMIARGHRIRVGDAPSGMIGWSIAHGQARVALEAEADAVRLATPELPETRSEAALPLRSRGRVLGALTVQDTKPSAFDEAALSALQAMADQVAVALDNARLFSESQVALEVERRAYGEFSHRAWLELTRSQAGLGYVCDREGFKAPGRWQPAMVEASRTGRPISDGGSTLAVPVKIGDHVEGAVRLCKPQGARPWTPDEVRLMETLAGQLGAALESARLYRDTQRRAAEERLVGEATARMRQTLDVDAVLDTAVEEMVRVLGLEALDLQVGIVEGKRRSGDHPQPRVPSRGSPPAPHVTEIPVEGKRRKKGAARRQGKRQDGDGE
ncbi:MAG: GAF domain-containing protein [Anaerolineae bacterium]|nr:GAF domain-containing protein [Anaerolineae bacterium]